MQRLFTDDEFKKSNYKTLLPCKCYGCNNVFFRKKCDIQRHIKDPTLDFNKIKYCSIKCFAKNGKFVQQEIECLLCKKKFMRTPSGIKQSKNHFCSRSCAATYNNTHKTKGTKVSKLEVWLAEKLTAEYPNLEIHYNRKDAINSELDIYIPSLKLAFELNGIFHYEPIYGEDKLKQIQNNDNRKFQACLENGIELVIIDSSSLSYFKINSAMKYFSIIENIIQKQKER